MVAFCSSLVRPSKNGSRTKVVGTASVPERGALVGVQLLVLTPR
jgi:hypothetical protein